METLLALQSDELKPTQVSVSGNAPSAEDLFLQEAHKSPMQRLREQILDSMGLTEDQLAQLPADQRRSVEDRIADIIKEKIREANGGAQSAQQTDLPSALQQFA